MTVLFGQQEIVATILPDDSLQQNVVFVFTKTCFIRIHFKNMLYLGWKTLIWKDCRQSYHTGRMRQLLQNIQTYLLKQVNRHYLQIYIEAVYCKLVIFAMTSCFFYNYHYQQLFSYFSAPVLISTARTVLVFLETTSTSSSSLICVESWSNLTHPSTPQ